MRKIIWITFLLFSFNSLYSSPLVNDSSKQKDDENEDGISVGMARAWVLFNNNDYYGALRIYKELHQKAPGNAKLNYRMGICFEALNEKDSAIIYISKSLEKDPEINSKAHYYLGRAYQFKGDLEKAISNYYTFKNNDPKQKTDVNRLLRQCETAKQMMENPVKVTITNLGDPINSEFVDASPSITADQQTLIFTSRRKENLGGQICEFNEQYFDDIYISTWDEAKKEWSQAKNIGSPINTEGFDANLSISPDGQTIFIYKNIEGETGSGDIYVSTFNQDQKWSNPKPIDEKLINSSFFESSASITSDGKTLYFVSERERGGFGFGDIWVSNKVAGQWSKPTNLGPKINTEFDEIGVSIHPDGKTLFFSSNGHNAIGMHDIFITTKDENGDWIRPINLGYPINTTKDEIHFVLTASKDKAYISSTRAEGKGMTDIYEVDMTDYFKTNNQIPKYLADQFTTEKLTILKGTVVDSDTGQPVQAQIKIENSKTEEKIIIESSENGGYFTTLPADQKYHVTVVSKDYKSFSFKMKSPSIEAGETPTTTKHIILNKQ